MRCYFCQKNNRHFNMILIINLIQIFGNLGYSGQVSRFWVPNDFWWCWIHFHHQKQDSSTPHINFFEKNDHTTMTHCLQSHAWVMGNVIALNIFFNFKFIIGIWLLFYVIMVISSRITLEDFNLTVNNY